MLYLRPSLVRYAKSTASATRTSAQRAIAERSAVVPFPVVQSCPSPTCRCADTPSGLEIDRSKNLNGTMPSYSQHLIISTGQSDWKSKIEDEKGTAAWGTLTANLKESLGRGGSSFDPYSNTVISASSFSPPKPTTASKSGSDSLSEALLFPAFRRFQGIGHDRSQVTSFIQLHLQPGRLERDPANDNLAATMPDASKPLASGLETTSISAPTVLICSHNSRDTRCGILGPLLHEDFTSCLQESTLGNDFLPHPSKFETEKMVGYRENVNVGMVSHVGGHAWAGNVIIYIPPTRSNMSLGAAIHPLAGMGIWYGRVEPKHVQGIVEETLVNGRVIKELFRGGIDYDRNILRL